ncbi:unnamed protein product [Caenorhabditis nigoni]
MDPAMVSRVRNRWIFFVIFVVLHRSLSVSMMQGLSVIMKFLTEKDPQICNDMPSWMASNLTKMAYSVVLLIVEFGLLLREQEAMADYLKHWTDARNVRREEDNTPNENWFYCMVR